MLDVVENTEIDHDVVAQPNTAAEATLAAEIATLWNDHKDSKAAARRTRAELKELRRDLGEKLHQMKSLLARTGRSGGWASYLRLQKLPLATADRYVQEHEMRLSPPTAKLLNEEFSEPTPDEIRQFAQKLLPKLCRVLTTQQSVYEFVHELVRHIPTADGRATECGVEVLRA
jgi:hypothetical protein